VTHGPRLPSVHPARPVCAAPTAAVTTLSTPLHSTIPYLNLRNRAPASKVLPSSAPPPFSPPRPPTRMPPTRGQTQFAAQRSRTAPLAAWPATSNGVRPRQSRARAGGTRLFCSAAHCPRAPRAPCGQSGAAAGAGHHRGRDVPHRQKRRQAAEEGNSRGAAPALVEADDLRGAHDAHAHQQQAGDSGRAQRVGPRGRRPRTRRPTALHR